MGGDEGDGEGEGGGGVGGDVDGPADLMVSLDEVPTNIELVEADGADTLTRR